MRESFKRTFLLAAGVLSLLLSVSAAQATTVEFLAGGGDVDAYHYAASYYHTRLNIVLPVSKRFEAFGGLEYIWSDEAEESGYGYRYDRTNEKYSFSIPGAGFGLRVKPFIGKRFQFSVMLGALAGKVYYKTDFRNTNLTPLSDDRGSAYFITPRFGWGINFRFNKQLSAVFETSLIGPAPAFNVVVANNKTGAVEDKKLNESGDLIGALIGLKYSY